MFVKTRRFSARELDRFRALQRTCFGIQTELANELRPGVTERDVASELFRRYKDAGAGNFFHLPVALFGERTALPGRWGVGKFYPRDVPLASGDAVILDGAPLFDGFLVDTSFSFALGDRPGHAAMMRALVDEREKIRAEVEAGASFRAVAERVAEDCSRLGYEGVHEKHPGRVLGHRTLRVRGLGSWRRQGFDAVSLGWFGLMSRIAGFLPEQSPLWNCDPSSEHAPTEGLWLVEPHFAAPGFGAKWEEILVIEPGSVRWLEPEPPHVVAWGS